MRPVMRLKGMMMVAMVAGGGMLSMQERTEYMCRTIVLPGERVEGNSFAGFSDFCDGVCDVGLNEINERSARKRGMGAVDMKRLMASRRQPGILKPCSSVVLSGWSPPALRLRGFGEDEDWKSGDDERLRGFLEDKDRESGDDDEGFKDEAEIEAEIWSMLEESARLENYTLTRYTDNESFANWYADNETFPGYQNPPLENANDEDWPYDPVIETVSLCTCLSCNSSRFVFLSMYR